MVASGGFGRVLATQGWQCQEFLAFAAPSPLKIGTARDCWLAGAFFWHCQGLLARGGFSPPSAGTARVFWLLQPPRPPPRPHAPHPRPRNRTVV